MYKVMIVGHGFVGSAIASLFSDEEKVIVDPKFTDNKISDNPGVPFDAVFVSVDTPKAEGFKLLDSILQELDYNIKLNDWLKSSFEPFPQKLTNIKLDFNINKLNPENKILIDESIKNFQAIYSENCRVYIRPSGTEPVMRVLVEAKNHKKVHSISSEITNKLILEIDKILN